MILYFKTPVNKNGNALQLTHNTTTGETARGFYLFGGSKDAVKLTKTELNKLYNILTEGAQNV